MASIGLGERGEFGYPPWGAVEPVPDTAIPLKCDVAIIGAGFTGLTAAYHLARDGADVAVFERARLSDSASARNAGFCTISPPFSAAALASVEGDDVARRWLQWFRTAVDRVEALVAELPPSDRARIDFRRVGCLRIAETRAQAGRLEREAEAQAALGAPVRFIDGARLGEKFALGHAVGAVEDHLSACLNPGALLGALSRVARGAGVVIAENCAALGATDNGAGRVQLSHSRGTTTARSLIVATNGYSDRVFSPFRDFVVPVGSFAIVTEPVDASFPLGALGEGVVASTSFRFPHYFRILEGRRLLFGGRSSLSTEADLKRCSDWLLGQAERVLSPIKPGRATACWGGQLAFTPNRRPLLGALDDRRFYSMGCAGHGVPTSISSGMELARHLSGRTVTAPFWRPAGLSPGAIRNISKHGLPVAQAYFRMRDIVDRGLENIW